MKLLLGILLSSVLVQAQTLPQLSDQQRQQLLQKMQETIQQLQQTQKLQTQVGGGGRGRITLNTNPAWWTNTALMTQLGLTDDQKTRVQRAYENHRLDIESRSKQVDNEEAQLAKLLAADPLDRNAVQSEIDRVVQARGELERSNSAMTLEMREVLTAAQWQQLQTPTVVRTPFGDLLNPNVRGGGPGQRSGGGRGTPGQRQQ